MTTATRICLDMLTAARAQREKYVGLWLPEPAVDRPRLRPTGKVRCDRVDVIAKMPRDTRAQFSEIPRFESDDGF